MRGGAGRTVTSYHWGMKTTAVLTWHLPMQDKVLVLEQATGERDCATRTRSTRLGAGPSALSGTALGPPATASRPAVSAFHSPVIVLPLPE